jgi:hypothetical protein
VFGLPAVLSHSKSVHSVTDPNIEFRIAEVVSHYISVETTYVWQYHQRVADGRIKDSWSLVSIVFAGAYEPYTQHYFILLLILCPHNIIYGGGSVRNGNVYVRHCQW